MNDDKVIYLVDIRDELQSFMHYRNLNDAWEALWDNWRKMNIRHRFRDYNTLKKFEDEGKMPRKDAESLCLYIHKNHFWKVLI